MYYCEECREKNEWPESLAQSKGTCELCRKYRVCHDRKSSTLPKRKSHEVKLGDYATGDGQYFTFDGRVYITAGNGWSAGDVGVMRWEDGDSAWMPVETLVVPLAMPPRPPTLCTVSRDAAIYVRQMEAYVDALESKE